MIGKIVGAVLGYLSLGPLGVLLGIAVGHAFDVGRARVASNMNPEQRRKVEQAFFHAVFPCLGYLAKADGQVSAEEIATTEEMMRRMGLSEAQRSEAIELFKRGKSSEFVLASTLEEFLVVSAKHPEFKQIFLVYLITLALADKVLHQGEENVLREVAQMLGFSSFAFNHLLGMVRAQMAFRERHSSESAYSYYREQHGSADYSPTQSLELAYEALGLSPDVSDAALKKAYRKLMSENHPDKLSGQGVPEDMVRLATERAQEVQSAYDLIKKSRKQNV